MYSTAFEKAVDHAMLYEVGGFWKLTPEVEAGLISTPAQKKAVGYVNDPLDRGGETKFGVAKNANPELDIAGLTWAEAKDVYYKKYWLASKCDQLPGRYAALHFDVAVNSGPGRAAKFLQRALSLTDDGVIGPVTLKAANEIDVFLLCESVCLQREQFYNNIVAKDPSQARFINGWMRRVNELRKFVLDPAREF